MLSVENLRVVYHDVISISNGVSLNAAAGEISVIIGANGAGKTTLLRAISGMLGIFDGDIIEGNIKVGDSSILGFDRTAILQRYGFAYAQSRVWPSAWR